MAKTLNRTLYVDLDSLLDTRLTSICTEFPQFKGVIDQFVIDGKYHLRKYDELGPITQAMWERAYSKRSFDTLQGSIKTNVGRFIGELCHQFALERIAESFRGDINVEVNTYPYQLSDSEQRVLVDLLELEFSLSASIKVSLTYLSPEQLTTQYVKDRFDILVMYDFHVWMEAQTPNFETCVIPNVTLYGPAIMRAGRETDEPVQEFIKKEQHPLKDLQLLASPLVRLQLIDAEVFSIVGFSSKQAA